MEKRDVLSILITFVVGFFAGGYLYVTHFATLLNPDSIPTAEEIDGFSIVGEVYGNCDDDCPAFQIAYDGSYRYQYTTASGVAPTLREGTLPLTLRSEVERSLATDELVQQSQENDPMLCASYEGGSDIVYTITLEAQQFTLDSCGTAVDTNGVVWTTLAKLWKYFETVE